jgi:DNA processing protein
LDHAWSFVQQVALSLIPGLGSRALAQLLDHLGSLDAICAASESDLRAVPRIGPKLAAAIRALDLDRAQADIAAWEADGITILLKNGEAGSYPPLLAALPDAPTVLFQRGTWMPADDRAIAVVGTRQPTRAARAWAATLVGKLAESGWTVISGLAAGIDTVAHQSALRAGGRTSAVLGCGVRVIYPPGHSSLAARIVERGALFSETHPDAAPNSAALVARNRLISGLSRAVIVVEAGESSGSLHAARFAQVQGRSVYTAAYPAPGNQQLIASGAHVLPLDAGAWQILVADLAGQS